jgi:hypothetical protein
MERRPPIGFLYLDFRVEIKGGAKGAAVSFLPRTYEGRDEMICLQLCSRGHFRERPHENPDPMPSQIYVWRVRRAAHEKDPGAVIGKCLHERDRIVPSGMRVLILLYENEVEDIPLEAVKSVAGRGRQHDAIAEALKQLRDAVPVVFPAEK